MPRCAPSRARFYSWGPYLSPFYSPLIDPHHHWWPFSPALLILAGPLGFRATCYYYRKALYRAFLLDPPACAVGEPAGRNYRGETGVSVHSAKRPSLLFLPCGSLHCVSLVRRCPFFFLRWPLRHRCRHTGPHFQRLCSFRSTLFPAIRSAILPAASSIAFPARPSAARDLRPGDSLLF